MLKNFPKKHLIILGIATTAVGALLATGSSQEAEAKKISINLSDAPSYAPMKTAIISPASSNSMPAIPTLSIDTNGRAGNMPHSSLSMMDKGPIPITPDDKVHTKTADKQETEAQWETFTVKSGDTLSRIFSRAGFNDKLIYKLFSDDKQNKKLVKIHPGQKISFAKSESDTLKAIKLEVNRLESILVSSSDNGKYQFSKVTIEPDTHTSYASGEIDSSLFLAAKTAGLDESVIMGLANIFGWDVDFSLDIRSGDKFDLVYEELFVDGEKIGNGKILAAHFTNKNKTYKAVLYTDKKGRSHYYTPDGHSMRKEFLRSPVEFARISSHFNLKRKHPVLHRIRAHRGTDYAASRGTPIRATGDGKIIHAGRKGGYGKAVIIKHGQKFTTLYAHMSKYGRGVRTGKKITQGQIIGYVGSTGLASGPHLHYEFRVNGVHKNPVTVSLPKAKHIPAKDMDHFKQSTKTYLSQLENLAGGYQVASNP